MIGLPVTTQPTRHIDDNLLLSYFVNVDRKALMLKYIQGTNAIFEAHVKYPIQSKHHAVYIARATVPLARFQNTDNRITHVYPSTVQNLITFEFNGFIDSNGYGVRHVN